RKAAEQSEAVYIRLLREETSGIALNETAWIQVGSVQEAVDFLKDHPGNVLAATGSRELHLYTQIPDYRNRVFARILSTAESMDIASRLGFQGRNLICMQGPFSEELNVAMLRAVKAAYLVTKESGRTGGFPEKIAAAVKAGARLIVVGRPPQETGYSFEEVIALLDDAFGMHDQEEKARQTAGDRGAAKPGTRTVTLTGIGMGAHEGMTIEAERSIREADLLIGADRMLRIADGLNEHALRCTSYLADEIVSCIASHEECSRIAVLLSGDIGFYSGARKLLDRLDDMEQVQVNVICGISSVVYLCGRLHTAWEDVRLVSLHGRKGNIVSAVARYPKVFALVGKQETFAALCRELTEYGLGDVRVSVGSRLSYPDEKILSGSASQMETAQTGDLCAVLIENSAADHTVTAGLEDEAFIRGQVPMTKSEVRSISLSKLRLAEDSIVYDIGAGTGSVSIEAARLACSGMVYAIEKKTEAVELIHRNMRHLKASNIQVIEGTAPDDMEDLPAPTHAFLGGTSGNMMSILSLLLRKNPRVRIVINAIALETVGETLRVLKELGIDGADITCVNISKAKAVGSYHLMMGQNPVYVIACGGKEAGQ
ncbi:MAG: precorrin-6y C5,15-methyltransferase (decarboxylating) subunit CbiE, partial [Lachnospiraceae bacterium]|nr:precorrin-6y C5,15-methyltransferase (decarboxylating) subunit CbiE [Lachnospiraceae bacterium]